MVNIFYTLSTFALRAEVDLALFLASLVGGCATLMRSRYRNLTWTWANNTPSLKTSLTPNKNEVSNRTLCGIK